jgi:hypothetical protein
MVSRSQRKWDGLWGWLGAPSLNEKVIPRFRSESPHNESGCLIATHNHLSSRQLFCKCMSMMSRPPFSLRSVIVCQAMRQ